MPKGVDHSIYEYLFGTQELVQKSLMPKGVDHPFHRYEEFLKGQCAKIFDAERR